MTERLTARGNRRRRQIIDAAASLFAEAGYHHTSVSDIVDHLGAGKGVFYWYFRSKDDLFGQILAHAQRSLRRAQRQAIADEPDPVRRIAQGIMTSFLWVRDNRRLFVLVEQARYDEQFAQAVKQGEEIAIADMLPHVRAGMDAGLIRKDDPRAVSQAIMGATTALVRITVLEGNGDPVDAAETSIAFCLNGILTRPGNTIPAVHHRDADDASFW